MRWLLVATVAALALVGCDQADKKYVDAVGEKLENKISAKIDEKFSELGGKIDTYQADVAKLRREVPDMVAQAMTAYMLTHGKPNGKTGGKPDELLVKANQELDMLKKLVDAPGTQPVDRLERVEASLARIEAILQECGCLKQRQAVATYRKKWRHRYVERRLYQPPQFEYTDPRYAAWYNNVYLPGKYAPQPPPQAFMQPAVQQGIAVGQVTQVVPAAAGPSFGFADLANIVNAGANVAAAIRGPAQTRINVSNQVQTFGGAGGAGGSVGNVSAHGAAAASSSAAAAAVGVTPTSGAAANQGATSGAASGR